MSRRLRTAVAALVAVLAGWGAAPAQAWGPRGHRLSVELAEQLIAGSRAERELRALLQPAGWRLADAAVRPDCLRGAGRAEGGHPECQVFPAQDLVQASAAFEGACGPRVRAEACHRRLHYTDVAIQREAWRPGHAGAREDDIVGALGAAIATLQGQPVRGPLHFANRREALAWLSHLVGDVHQPLHVGALYLDAQGERVDPDHDAGRTALDTVGGNRLWVGAQRLHGLWDSAPPQSVDAAWLAEARRLPRTDGPLTQWPQRWADETLGVARQVLGPLRFGPLASQPSGWPLRGDDDPAVRERLQRQQLLRAGARLAQLLQAIWP